MYTVIGAVRSRTARVLWMLEELSEPYEYVAAPPRSDAVREHNPSGKVPVLIDGGTAIIDSTAILTYLADKHQAFTFPAGTVERALQDSLTQFVLDEIEGLIWTAARHSFILPEDRRVPAIKDSLRWEFAENQKTLVRRMGSGPYLMGETMTVPDIVLTHCGIWAAAAKFPVTEPAFRDYVDRMRRRPAFERAMSR